MPRYYPISLDIQGRTCLVVGGGSVAERKVNGLLEAGARIRIVSLAFTPALQALADSKTIEAYLAPYRPDFLTGIFLVFAATDNREVNAQVTADAQALGLMINVADAPEEGQFITPSTVRRGELCLTISTGGNNPMLASRLCEELEARFGPEYGEFVELLGQMRDYIKERTALPARRRLALAALLDNEAALRTLLLAENLAGARTLAENMALAALQDTGTEEPEGPD